MRRIAGIAAMFLYAATAFAADAKLTRRVSDYLAPLVKSRDFNGVILIAKGDRVLAQNAYGAADFDFNVPLNLRSRFRIASITKAFTAAAVTMLAERGKLSLTDPLAKYVPEFPAGDKILIRHLLLHQSGVGNPSAPPCSAATLDDLIADLAKKPLSFEPGTAGRYSNGGYALLARVIEKVSGKPWADFVRDEISIPLKLGDTATDHPSAVMPMRVRGFVPGPGAAGVEHAQCEGAWATIGGGTLISTAIDLYRFARSVDEETLFKRSALEYPYGWGERKYFDRRVIEQSGELNGATSYLAAYLDDDLYVVVLSNLQRGSLTDLGKGLAALALGETPPKLLPSPSSVAWTAAERARWLGKFHNQAEGYGIELLERDGDVYLRWADSPDTVYVASTARSRAYNRQNSVALELATDDNAVVLRWSDGAPHEFKRVP